MRLVLRNLARRQLRSFLAVLGIAIGIAAVVGLISLARGFEQELDDMLTRLRGDIIIKEKNRVTPQSSRLDETLVAEIAGLDGVAGASGYTFQLFFFGEFRVPIYGFHPDQPIGRKVRLVTGRRIAPDGLREVMVGAEAARNLGIEPGQKIRLPPSDPDGQQVEVVGIFSTGSRFQDIGCIVHLRTAQLVGRMPGQVMMLAVDLDDRGREEAVRDALRARYPALEVQLAREFTQNLVNDPPILLADEPTGNLDSATGLQVLEVLTDVHRERDTLLVIVTHNAEIADRADRVLAFRDGQLT